MRKNSRIRSNRSNSTINNFLHMLLKEKIAVPRGKQFLIILFHYKENLNKWLFCLLVKNGAMEFGSKLN